MYEITNDEKIDAIKDNFIPPQMTEMHFDVAKELIDRIGLRYVEFQDYIKNYGETIDREYYWTKEVTDFIKKSIDVICQKK